MMPSGRLDVHNTMVWCQETLPDWLPAGLAVGLCTPPLFFQTSVWFIRWLFEPPCPSERITSPKTLVVGWREAKPCTQAILARRTGDTRGLRPDQKRPAFQPLHAETGECSLRGKETAIQTVIVVVDGERQEARALKWARDGHEGLDVHVVSTPSAFRSLLQAVGVPRGLFYSPPPGLECRHIPTCRLTHQSEEQDTGILRSSPMSVLWASPSMRTIPQRFQGCAIACTIPPQLQESASSIRRSTAR
mmetsp:Transcript_52239/g.125811  ORF Transcript_52239/g.125811 Transcript_52239/m.125811 type:complete len:247 (+) Transcript_52239:3-743(+)